MDEKEFLKNLHNPWLPIAMKALKAEKGRPHEPITREEITYALENSAEAPPPVVRKILVDILNGNYKFKRGIKARPYPERRNAVLWFLAILDKVEKHPKAQPIREAATRRGDLTSREMVLALVAAKYSITGRTLENWIKEHESIVLEAHRRGGKTFDSLRQALDYERDLEAAAKYRAVLDGWPLPPLK